MTFVHFPGSGLAGEPTGPTRGSRSFQVSLNRTLHDSCLRARAGPRHGAVRVMLLPLPWAVAACGSSWQVPAVPAPWVLQQPALLGLGTGCLGVCPALCQLPAVGTCRDPQRMGENRRGHQVGIPVLAQSQRWASARCTQTRGLGLSVGERSKAKP